MHHVTCTGFVSSRHETSCHIVPLWFLVSRFVMHGFAPKKKDQKRVYITISDGKARIRDGINVFNALEGYLHWVSGREQAKNKLRPLQECHAH